MQKIKRRSKALIASVQALEGLALWSERRLVILQLKEIYGA